MAMHSDDDYMVTEEASVGYQKRTLIDHVNLHVKKGEILTLIGPNGVGKSTILKSIIRQLSLIAGTVSIDGKELSSYAPKELAKKMAIVMTERIHPERYTCYDVVATGRYPYTGKMGMLQKEDEEKKEPFIFDERIHIPLEEARKIVPNIEVGETIEEEVTPKDFGRVAAATAKQVVVQKIREAERNTILNEYQDKQDELVSGIVEMEDARNYYIGLGKTQGILPKTEIIPGETIKMGSNIKVYITKVESNSKGPIILLSRCHYGFVT